MRAIHQPGVGHIFEQSEQGYHKGSAGPEVEHL
jgi:hypothetical protein